jgi:hypothetical protein
LKGGWSEEEMRPDKILLQNKNAGFYSSNLGKLFKKLLSLEVF